MGGWVGGWLDYWRIKLTSNYVEVEVVAELGNLGKGDIGGEGEGNLKKGNYEEQKLWNKDIEIKENEEIRNLGNPCI